MNESPSPTPPHAPFALRIGITGHRLEPPDTPQEKRKRSDPDTEAIIHSVREILDVISASFKGVADTHGHLFDLTCPEEPENGSNKRPFKGSLRIISALAEGPDQWVAQEAMAKDYELQAIIPLNYNEYLNDFWNEEDKKSFRKLFRAAAVTMELDGKVGTERNKQRKVDSRSYESVGRAILRQSDLLIAVWDGEPAKGKGGTGQVVYEALQYGIPVLWVPWSTPGQCKLSKQFRMMLEPSDIWGEIERLGEQVRKLLVPPVENTRHGIEAGKSLRQLYFDEIQKKGNIHLGMWTLFRNTISGKAFENNGLKKIIKAFKVDGFEEKERYNSGDDWILKKSVKEAKMEFPFDDPVRLWVDSRYLKHYAWANGLSNYYGHMHRSAFLMIYLLGAAAVFLALVCMASGITGRAQTGWIIAELVVITGILLLTYMGRRQKWHQKWIDYRTLAERLRLARCLSLFGGGAPPVVYEGHLASYGNPANTWMNWHYRAIERAAGIPPVKYTAHYLASCQEFWRESLIEDQILYHKETFRIHARLDSRLHKLGDIMFIATLLACAIHLAHLWFAAGEDIERMPEYLGGWMTLVCAFLPAVGAAFAAIRSHGELQRITQRSKAMEEALTHLKAELADTPVAGDSLNSVKLRGYADRISDLMTNELLDWRVVFQDRPLGLP
jgi:hypothetical protein